MRPTGAVSVKTAQQWMISPSRSGLVWAVVRENQEVSMARRSFLSQVIALPFLGMTAWSEQATHKPLKIMMKSAWGSDDPTKAAFPFLHGLALSEAGHSVQVFLLGEAVSVRFHCENRIA